jgi:hypothetical protein
VKARPAGSVIAWGKKAGRAYYCRVDLDAGAWQFDRGLLESRDCWHLGDD